MSRPISRRRFLTVAGAGVASAFLNSCPGAPAGTDSATSPDRPNFIVIFIDDMGYGDLGCFGSKVHQTPNLDRMGAEGIRFTSFYVTSGVCTPSRASLMTGCYPKRVDMHEDSINQCVLFPCAKKGLNPNEITIAEILKKQSYATCCIGKWHLGDQPDFLPTRQGFDYYYGIPYSNDMGGKKRTRPPLPLLRNETVIEAPADQNTLTKRYTAEAINFIKNNKDKPFFIYLPHTMVHNPLHAGDHFRGKSANGIYGDAVEEIDWSTGQILKTLKDLTIDKNTLVVFTSDNGAASNWGGANKPLQGFKGSTWEGGMREPAICWWPGQIPAGKTCDEIATTMDILPTFAKLAGTKAPTDRIIDGKDIWPLLAGEPGARTPHEAFYYYQIDQLQAVRSGKWKLHLPLKEKKKNWGDPDLNVPLQLYDLQNDIAESNNLADRHPKVVEQLSKLAQKAIDDLGTSDVPGKNIRPAAYVKNPKPLLLNRN